MISVTSQCTWLGSWWRTDPLRKNKPLFIGKCAQILRSTSPLSLRSMLDAPPASTLACAHQTGASALNLFDQWGEKEQAHLCYWSQTVSALAPVWCAHARVDAGGASSTLRRARGDVLRRICGHLPIKRGLFFPGCISSSPRAPPGTLTCDRNH